DFWTDLDKNPAAATPYVQDFTRLLRQPDSLPLVQLVLPELRGTCVPEAINETKQRILADIMDLREEISRVESTQQADFDDVFYQEEKQIFEEAEIYRAELLLFSSGSLTDSKKDELLQWWGNRPAPEVGAVRGSSSTKDAQRIGQSDRTVLRSRANEA
ncbi:MAG: hypothetical protein Q9198_003420, partial [Flavoplaca austrocitrina]